MLPPFFLFVAWSGDAEVPRADPLLILGKYLPTLGNLWVFGEEPIHCDSGKKG